MRNKGKIVSYNVSRGFGFIGLDEKKVFFHITDMPFKNCLPNIGENVTFLIENNNGKSKAVSIERIDFKSHKMPSKVRNRPHKHKEGINLISIFITIISISIFGFVLSKIVSNIYHREELRNQSIIVEETETENPFNNIHKDMKVNNQKNQYKCDGRVYCTQMTSYEEAVYFINHCPGTKMDGNYNGVPCEKQFNR